MFNNFIEYEYQPYHNIYTDNIKKNSIFLGDVQAALNLQFIKTQKIKLVVTAAIGMDQVSYSNDQVKHIIYPLLDSKNQNISKFFNQFYQLIEEQLQNGNILVHCAAGISRSATLVISYMMKKNHWSFKQAVKFVRQKRPVVLPNLGFQRQLKQYESSVKRNSYTSEFNQRHGLQISKAIKNALEDSCKIEALPDIKKLRRNNFVKSKVLERNLNMKLESDNSHLFPYRKYEIYSHQSVHQTKMLKSKPLLTNNSVKNSIMGKVESARSKVLQRFNNPLNNFHDLSPFNPYKNQNYPSESIHNKKVSSLSHRTARVSQQLKLRRNDSNYTKQKKPISIILVQEMGQMMSNKIKFEQKKAKTQKNIRKRGIHRIFPL